MCKQIVSYIFIIIIITLLYSCNLFSTQKQTNDAISTTVGFIGTVTIKHTPDTNNNSPVPIKTSYDGTYSYMFISPTTMVGSLTIPQFIENKLDLVIFYTYSLSTHIIDFDQKFSFATSKIENNTTYTIAIDNVSLQAPGNLIKGLISISEKMQWKGTLNVASIVVPLTIQNTPVALGIEATIIPDINNQRNITIYTNEPTIFSSAQFMYNTEINDYNQAKTLGIPTQMQHQSTQKTATTPATISFVMPTTVKPDIYYIYLAQQKNSLYYRSTIKRIQII